MNHHEEVYLEVKCRRLAHDVARLANHVLAYHDRARRQQDQVLAVTSRTLPCNHFSAIEKHYMNLRFALCAALR